MEAFQSEHQLCSDYCHGANSVSKITRATYNVSTGYMTIWHYFNYSFDKKAAVSRLNKLFEEYKLAEAGWCLPWKFSTYLAP